MKKNLYFTLTIVMIAFALCISLTLSTYYYVKTKKMTIEHENIMLDEHIKQLVSAVDTNEKVIHHFGNTIAEQMQKTSIILSNLYESTGTFSNWDFSALSVQYNVDIYIINDKNIIEYSNVENEIGLDFNQCCQTLVSLLESRRLSNLFYDDGLDAEQSTGELKKYSYMSTPDHKYLIQLGLYWKDSSFYSAFQFDNVANQLINDRINSIRLLNIEGNPLGNAHADYKLSSDYKAAFNQALQSNQKVIYEPENIKSPYSYIYVPITSSYDLSYTNKKVIEIVYDKTNINEDLIRLGHFFALQIMFILFVTTLLSMFIAHKFSKPIFLAFHDSLTKLGNRAYLSEYANTLILKDKPFTLIMFDIDNFKMVNDRYGHAIGDEVIKQTATLLSDHSRYNGYSFRLGGDEFVIILLTNDKQVVNQTVNKIATTFNNEISPIYPNKSHPTSLSIGIAYAKENGQHLDDIIKAADEALYTAKKAGKNQFITSEKAVAP